MTVKTFLLVFVFTLSCLIANGRELDETLTRGQQEARPFFGGGFPFPGGFGDLSPILAVFQCTPFNRTFVQTGVPCIQQNMTALNCRNESCVCNAVPLPTAPPGMGQFPPSPFQVPLSMWNCGTSGFPVITLPGTNSTSTTVAPGTNSTTPLIIG